jgi:hypothetical protein
VLVALNFGDKPASVAYHGLTRPGNYTDWFAKTSMSLGGDGRIDIPPNGYRVFVK